MTVKTTKGNPSRTSTSTEPVKSEQLDLASVMKETPGGRPRKKRIFSNVEQ